MYIFRINNYRKASLTSFAH